MAPLARWVLGTLLFLAAVLASAPDEEIVREFRRYFRKLEDRGSRVEAVLALEGTESAEVVEVLLPVLRDDDAEVVDAVVRVLAGFESQAPAVAVVAALPLQKNESVRLGLLRVFAEAGYEGSAAAAEELLEDRSWPVRRRAIQAVAAGGDPAAAEKLRPSCEDRAVAVRCSALDALAGLRSELVVAPAIADLRHPAWQVRASAAAALGEVRRLESIEPLIAAMEREEGRLLEDLAVSLELLTGRRYGQRSEQWRKFWEGVRERYVLLTDEEMQRLQAKRAEYAEQYEARAGNASFHGIDTPSRSILFVIDVSGSMENLVIDRERFAAGDYPSMKRIDIVKTELARTIERLESNTRFNVISFATEVDTWKKKLVPANVLNKKSGVSYALRLEAIGGHSKEHLADAGLIQSANLEAGKTNTHAALMAALGFDPERAGKKDEYEIDVDTIYFLSDGRPSHGEFVDPGDILRVVREVNELRRAVIHTIAIGQFQKDFMRRLAEQNGGVFVDLGA